MTPKQAEVLQAIRDLTVDGVPPSYPEIQERVGLSSRSQVHRAVQHLIKHGCVTKAPGSYRTLKVVDQGPSRAEMERWSDAEVERVHIATDWILNSRERARRAAA